MRLLPDNLKYFNQPPCHFFFFALLVDVPLQKLERGKIFFFEAEIGQVADGAAHRYFVCRSMVEHFAQRFKFILQIGNLGGQGTATHFIDLPHELQRVDCFLVHVIMKKLRSIGISLGLAPRGQDQTVEGQQPLHPHLLVQLALNFSSEQGFW